MRRKTEKYEELLNRAKILINADKSFYLEESQEAAVELAAAQLWQAADEWMEYGMKVTEVVK